MDDAKDQNPATTEALRALADLVRVFVEHDRALQHYEHQAVLRRAAETGIGPADAEQVIGAVCLQYGAMVERDPASAETPTDPIGLSEAGLDVMVAARGTLTFAMEQNGVPLVNNVCVRNPGSLPLRGAVLTLHLQPDLGPEASFPLPEIAAFESVQLGAPDYRLPAGRLRQLVEAEKGRLAWSVRRGSEELASGDSPVDVLAFNEWPSVRGPDGLLASFVLPNHPAIGRFLKAVSTRLGSATGDDSLAGYQYRSRERVVATVNALYQELQEAGVSYITAPSSFMECGQKIRLPDDVLADRMGCCLDLTVFHAACLEQMGLHPLLILIKGHAFPGVWLVEDRFPEGIVEDAARLRNQVEIGNILLYDATAGLRAEHPPLAAAAGQANALIANDETFHQALDVRALRERFRPLPIRNSSQGTVDWTEEPPLPVAHLRTVGLPSQDERPASAALVRPAKDVPPQAAARFRKWQDRLLDLSLRNRLLRVSANGTLPVQIPELALFENMLAADRAFEIHPMPPEDARDERNPDLDAARGVAAERDLRRLRDLKAGVLHSGLSDGDLWLRARKLIDGARRDIEESGANSLYVALGMLKWIDPEGRTSLAPLLLYPVRIDLDRARRRVQLHKLSGDPVTNVTLVEKLRREYQIDLPTLANPPEDESGLDMPVILNEVRKAIQARNGWEVLEVAQIGSFTFTKFVMWKDLEDHAKRFLENDVVALISTGTGAEALYRPGTEVTPSQVDSDAEAARMPCVVDADSTQMAAIASAMKGRSMVLQGPPGTGKSQTIANLIAASMAAGKSVLFVSEKMAALEVVHRRLKQVGLDDFCLELHSHKSNRKDVAESIAGPLRRTSRLPRPSWEDACDELVAFRSQLNGYAEALHQSRPLGTTVYEAGARLLELKDAPDVRFPLPDAPTMTASEFAAAREVVADFAVHAAGVEPVLKHPFAGTNPGDWTAGGEDRLSGTLDAVITCTDAVDAAAGSAASVLQSGSVEWSTSLLADLATVGNALAEGPVPPAAADSAGWGGVTARARDYLARRRIDDERRSRIESRWTREFFSSVSAPMTARFERWAGAFFLLAWLFLWGPRRALKPYSKGPLPSNAQILNDLREVAASNASLDALGVDGRWVAGVVPGTSTPSGIDLDGLERAIDRGDAVSSILVRLRARQGSWADSVLEEAAVLPPDRRDAIGRESARLSRACNALDQTERALAEGLGVMRGEIWPLASDNGHRAVLRQRSQAWRSNLKTFRSWCLYREATGRLEGIGFSGLAVDHSGTVVKASDLSEAFEKRVLSQWLQAICDADPVLRGFTGDAHDHVIQKFADKDRAHVRLARNWVVWSCEQRLPQPGMAFPEGSEAGIILRNAAKQRGQMSTRTLLQRLPTILPRLKPCLLMSPLSVAQYLPAEGQQFDLVVFDEASQIATHDAIGAIARGRQVVVVGDSHQMPPTTFFQRMNDDEAGSQDENDVVELESVLDEAVACRIPEQMLGWHYRSRHETLIDFSNQNFYGGRLHVFPAARARVEDLGVRWHPVQGVYFGTGSKEHKCTNPIEAKAVVDHLVGELRLCKPGDKTFGVVAFSLSQRDLIADLLEAERARHPEIDPHFAEDLPERVFVKNLENVQGDERDVIYFSIAYAKDSAGKLRLHFGPLSVAGGERRLNVAVTRARAQLHVFSTLSPEEIDLNRTSSQGARLLKSFLEMVRAGDGAKSSADDEPRFASTFERDVFERLREAGLVVQTRVGRGDYRVDLAVSRKSEPGVYAMGIECDGPSYRSARTARDRDRLRRQVMEGMGWRLARVWSRDWSYDAPRQVERLLAELAASEKGLPESVGHGVLPRQAAPTPPDAALPEVGLRSTAATPIHEPSEPYVHATVPFATMDLDLTGPTTRQDLHERVWTVAQIESPVHVQTVARRVLPAFGHDKLKPSARRLVERVIEGLVRSGDLQRRGDFVWRKDHELLTWSRFRRPVNGSEVRDLDVVAPEEIAAALEWVLKNSGSMGREDLLRAAMRLFGISRLGKNVQLCLEGGLGVLEQRGLVRLDGDNVFWLGP